MALGNKANTNTASAAAAEAVVYTPDMDANAGIDDPNAVFACDFSQASVISTCPDGPAAVLCTEAEWRLSKAGNKYWLLRLKINAPTAPEGTVYGSIRHMIFLPDMAEPDQEKKTRAMVRYRAALQAFGLAVNVGHAPQDLIGCSARCMMATETYNGEFQNKVDKFLP